MTQATRCPLVAQNSEVRSRNEARSGQGACTASSSRGSSAPRAPESPSARPRALRDASRSCDEERAIRFGEVQRACTRTDRPSPPRVVGVSSFKSLIFDRVHSDFVESPVAGRRKKVRRSRRAPRCTLWLNWPICVCRHAKAKPLNIAAGFHATVGNIRRMIRGNAPNC
jgi:hypothetical protein